MTFSRILTPKRKRTATCMTRFVDENGFKCFSCGLTCRNMHVYTSQAADVPVQNRHRTGLDAACAIQNRVSFARAFSGLHYEYTKWCLHF